MHTLSEGRAPFGWKLRLSPNEVTYVFVRWLYQPSNIAAAVTPEAKARLVLPHSECIACSTDVALVCVSPTVRTRGTY